MLGAFRTYAPGGNSFQNYELSRSGAVGYDVRMFQNLLAVAAWTVLAFITYASISPIQDRPTLPTSFGFDGFDHLAAFAVLGALFYLAYPRQIVLVCLIVLGSAALLEFAQLLTPDRHARIHDAIEKMMGGVAGIVAGRVLLCFEQTNRRFRN
jgi:VanZ family protein